MGRVAGPIGAPRGAPRRALAARSPTLGARGRTRWRHGFSTPSPGPRLASRNSQLPSEWRGSSHPSGDAPQPPRARRLGLEWGTGRFTPHLRPCAPHFRLDLCAVWRFTWLLISTFTLVFWVEKWPKFTQRSLMSVFNHPCSFCDERTVGRFQCRGGSDFVFSLEEYYLIYLPRIDIQWRFFTSGLDRLLGNTEGDV